MLAVAIVGVLTQIVVIGYEMGDMILENVRAAIALAKKIARFVGRKVCGWESADEEEAEDDDEDGDEEKPPKKKGAASTTKIVVLD